MKKILFALLSFFSAGTIWGQPLPTLVHNIYPGTPGSLPQALTVFNSELYLSAMNSNGNNQLWKTNGSTTSQATTMPNGGVLQQPKPMAVANGKLFFVASTDQVSFDNRLWCYTGTGTPTLLSTTHTAYATTKMATLGNKVYFLGGESGVYGIYAVDATNNTIQIAVNFSNQQVNGSPMFTCPEMVAYDNKLYFIGINNEPPQADGELFIYDPANSNVTQLASLCTTCPHCSAPNNLYVADNNKLYFSAVSASEGRELYEIDGANAAVKLTSLNTINDGLAGAWTTSYTGTYHEIAKMGNFIYFAGAGATLNDFELMKLDLSNNTTSLVKDINIAGSSRPAYMTIFDSQLYFGTHDTPNGDLWRSDGTTAGTTKITDVNTTCTVVKDLCVYNNRLYFSAQEAVNGRELYRLGDPTGIEVVSRTNSIRVYPVPAQDVAIFEIDLVNASSLSISLADMSGKMVYNSPVQNFGTGLAKISVPVKELASGTYSYTISSGNGELIGSGRISH